jgi:hypothetical protein
MTSLALDFDKLEEPFITEYNILEKTRDNYFDQLKLASIKSSIVHIGSLKEIFAELITSIENFKRTGDVRCREEVIECVRKFCKECFYIVDCRDLSTRDRCIVTRIVFVIGTVYQIVSSLLDSRPQEKKYCELISGRCIEWIDIYGDIREMPDEASTSGAICSSKRIWNFMGELMYIDYNFQPSR